MRGLSMALIACAASAQAQVATFEGQLKAARATLNGVRAAAHKQDLDVERLLRIAADPARPEADRVDAIRLLRVECNRNRDVNRTLARLAEDREESTAIRIRAAQSLGMAISLLGPEYRETLKLLTDLREDPTAPMALRVMASKALHWATVNEHETRTMMLDGLSWTEPEPLRTASAWALASSSGRDEVRSALLKAFEEPDAPLSVRVQALKSIYPASNRWDIWPKALDAAKETRLPLELRETAVLFLSGARTEDKVRRELEEMLDDAEPRVRAAAARALDPIQGRELWYFFRLRWDPIRHRMIEVLELED